MSKIDSIDEQNPEESLRRLGHPTNAHEHLLTGEAYFLLGDYHKAEDELDCGLSHTNQRSVYTSAVTEQLFTARCFLEKFEQASKDVIRFKHLMDPSYLPRWEHFPNTHKWPASMTTDWVEYVVMCWLESGGRRRPDLAEKLCRSLSRLSPDEPKVWFNLGRACADQGKFDLAIAAFTEHLKLRPDSIDALVSRAWCHNLSGKLRECREDAERIRRLDPNDSDLRKLLEELGNSYQLGTEDSAPLRKARPSICSKIRRFFGK